MTTAIEEMTVMCDPCTDPRWQRLSESRGHLFHSPRWLRVLRDGYGLRPQALLAGGGGIAWVHVRDVRGRRVRCLPFSDLGGPIDGSDSSTLIPSLRRLWTNGEPVAMRVVTGHPDQIIDGADIGRLAAGLDLDPTPTHTWHWTDLRHPVDAEVTASSEERWEVAVDDPLWTALSPKARQNIRRARRAGFQVDIRSDRGALAVFEGLHRGLRRRKYRLLSQPKGFFDALHRHFAPDRLAVVMARIDGRPVAGVVLLRHRDWGYYKFNASNAEGSAGRANDLVMWSALVQARHWGCRRFDHGLSDLDQPGLIRYKDKFATGRGEIVTLTRTGRRSNRLATPLDRGLAATTRLATADRSPEWVADGASRMLYRMFC